MRSYLRVLGLVAIAAPLCLVQGREAVGACAGFSGTADGFDRVTAVTRAQEAVAAAIAQYKAQKRLGAISVSGMRARPQPYWRASVSSDLFYKPDIVKPTSHTVCWRGVVSPYVCTSGAKVCW